MNPTRLLAGRARLLRSFAAALALALLLASPGAPPQPALAATLVVTSTADSGPGSLREAIMTFVGVRVDGSTPLPNEDSTTVSVDSRVEPGGTAEGAGNVIAGNRLFGVAIIPLAGVTGPGGPPPQSIAVRGNQLGAADVTTDANGLGTFSLSVGPLEPDEWVSATATGPESGTSELSPPVAPVAS